MNKLNVRSLLLTGAIFASGLAFITPGQAQIVELPKVWLGTHTGTIFGAPSELNPKHSANVGTDKAVKDFNTFVDENFKFEILRQMGRHLEIRFANSKHSLPAVGTLSADGKLMLVKTTFFTIPFTINGNSISGCGGSNGNGGTIDHWMNNYGAICFEATAVAK